MSSDKLESLVGRLENVTQRLEKLGSHGGSGGGDAEFIPPFEELIANSVLPFAKLSEGISSEVKTSANMLLQGFNISLEILKMASVSKKPSDAELGTILKPLSEKIAEIKSFGSKNFKSDYRSHLEAVGAISVGLGWYPAPMKPQSIVKEAVESGMFYSNRVLTSFKDKGAQHKEWVHALIKCFKDLQQYVEDYHSTGCCWNLNGKTASAPSTASCPPPVVTSTSSSRSDAVAPSAVNLLADLNKGLNITSGLKKVDDSLKTHKNPNLRAGSTVVEKEAATKSTKKAATSVADKPPVFEQQGKKWVIENQKNQDMLIIDQGDMGFTSQIWNCKQTNMKFTTKINTVSIEGCVDCKFQLTAGLIGSCDIINCKKIDIHADETIPFVTVNNTDSCQIYLNQKSIGTKISTAKSSSVNVCVWDQSNELKEYPVPYQFISSVENGKLKTVPAEDI